MKPDHESSQLSLPLLLSFNELAWIVIFAIGLICLANIKKDQDDIKELKSVIIAQQLTINSLKHKLAEAEKTKLELEDNLRATNKLLAESQEKLTNAMTNATNQAKTYRKADQDLKELARKLEEAQKERDGLRQQLDEALAKLRKVEPGARNLITENQQLAALNRDLSNQVSSLNARINELERTNKVPVETSVRRELLRLRGKMENVAILLDRSGSMNATGNAPGAPSRWNNVVSVVESWLKYVPVKRCVFIPFNTYVQAYPEKGLYQMEGSEGETNRDKMLQKLRELKPELFTNTKEALRVAYSYEDGDKIDTILLFTDGAPTLVSESFNNVEAKEVIKLVNAHPNIPINVVALGDYTDSRMIGFLLTIQQRTGGKLFGEPLEK